MNPNFYMGIVLHFLQWLVRSYGTEVFLWNWIVKVPLLAEVQKYSEV